MARPEFTRRQPFMKDNNTSLYTKNRSMLITGLQVRFLHGALHLSLIKV
jgi:hypothetical protein